MSVLGVMKGHTSIFLSLVIVCSISAFSQTRPDPQRYTYRISGNVTDEYWQPMVKIFVCWHGRADGIILCAKTDEDGNFDLTVADTPKTHWVTASDCTTSMLDRDDRHGCRLKSSGMLEFGSQDESRTIDFHFDSETNGGSR
jgi:hypothetical protein